MPHASSDVSSNDEVKVYRVEGEGDDESSAENLKEEKRSLLTEVALKEESRAVESSDRSIPSSESPHHNHGHHQTHVGALSGGKHFEYFPSPPFGYVPGYHPHARGPYGALPMVGRVPLVPSNHPPSPLSLMMYSAEQFQPPPAHMGIHIDPKTGMPRPSVFPLPPSQFHPPHVFPPDYSQQYSWHHSPVYPVTPGFRSPPYPIALSPLIHPLMPPAPNKQERNDNQDGRSLCNFSPSSPFSPLSNGSMHHHQNQQQHQQQRRAPRISNEQRAKKKASHIKKPLNAFMLFMKEQRPQVVAECTLKESAAINQILGKKWHSLSRDEQSKYYEMARSERQMHMQRYPGWTARDNYAINAKKKKRKRDKSQDGDGNNPKKCRARFGLDKQSSWCKPCRRKKKCIRYRSGSDNTAGESEDNIGSVGSAQTPDSRYGAEEEEEEELSDTDSGNEEDASSEFSLSSPPVSSITIGGGPLPTAPSLQSPPSHQSSHPLNVEMLSQPHTPKAASHSPPLEQISVCRGPSSPSLTQKNVESHQTKSHLPLKADESQLMQKAIESQSIQKAIESQSMQKSIESQSMQKAIETQSMQRAIESQSMQKSIESHMLQKSIELQSMQKTIESQSMQESQLMQNNNVSHLPQKNTKSQLLQNAEADLSENILESHLQRLSYMADPHMLSRQMMNSQHYAKDPHLSADPRRTYNHHHTKDPQMLRTHLATEPRLPHPHHSKDHQLPLLKSDTLLHQSHYTKGPQLPYLMAESRLPLPHHSRDSELPGPRQVTDSQLPRHTKLQRPHQTTDPNLSRPHPTTESQLSRLHHTNGPQLSRPHNSKDPQLSRTHSAKDPQLQHPYQMTDPKSSLPSKGLQRLHQTLDSNLPRPLPMADIQPHSTKDSRLQLSYPKTELPLMRTSVETHQAALQST